MSKVTIQTVADKAGVSIKTVSRVINKETSVSDKTRTKVEAIVTELGYEPSPAARALASNSSKLIGLIYDNPSAAYVMDVQTGVLKTCYEEGFNLLIHPCNYESKSLTDELVNLVQRSRLDGLILTPPLCDMQDTVNALVEKNINVVNIAPANPSDNLSSVSCNDAEVVKEITLELINKGHTRIGFILGHVTHGAAYQRYIGYQRALEERKIPLNRELILQGDFSFDSGVSCGKKLLELKNRPTAIFASNDYMAAGVIKIAKELNINVPSELSVVGYDDAPVSRQIWPSLSTVSQPVQKMAARAAKILIDQVSQPNKVIEHPIFTATAILRGTTRVE